MIEEIRKECDGKLHNLANIYLRVKLEKVEELELVNKLSIRVRLDSSIADNNIKKDIVKGRIILLMNGIEVSRDSVKLELGKNSVLLNYEKNLVNKDTKIYNIKAVLETESPYISNTEIEHKVIVLPIKEEKLFITLNKLEGNRFRVDTNIKPDFIEYKLGDTKWVRLEDKVFKVEDYKENEYLQVRGKYKSKYTYSNVIRLSHSK